MGALQTDNQKFIYLLNTNLNQLTNTRQVNNCCQSSPSFTSHS